MDRAEIKTLFAQAKAGNETSFNLIYKEYYSPIFKYIYYRTKSKTETEDLTQEVFVKFYKNIGNFEVGEKDPICYFFTIAKNTVIDWQRKKKPVYSEELIESAPDDKKQPFESDYLAGKIMQTLKLLPTDQQEAVALRIIQGYDNKKIAQILNTSEGNVRQLQSRAFKKLRDYMKIYK
jgi:RNA polymerase sigma-70 factor (ECF subfamily)